MNRYVFDRNGFFTGQVLVLTEFDTYPGRSTETAPPLIPAGQFARWDGTQWHIVSDRVITQDVPSEITKRQGRQQLITMGLISSVQTAIDAIPDATQKALIQSFWDDSTVYERYHPQMIALSSAIGLDEASLDAAFIAASQL